MRRCSPNRGSAALTSIKRTSSNLDVLTEVKAFYARKRQDQTVRFPRWGKEKGVSSPLTTPIVYACSGSSNTGQMANYIALCLDRSRVAKMSCTAGMGGDVPAIVGFATWGRPAVVIDGCHRHCAKRCLARHGITPDRHYTLTDFSIRKWPQLDFDESEAALIFEHICVALTPPAGRRERPGSESITKARTAESNLR